MTIPHEPRSEAAGHHPGQEPGERVRRVLRNSGELFVSGLFTKVANVFYYFWVIRLLGQGDYGRAILAATLVGLHVILVDLGTLQVFIRESARDPEKTPRYFSAVFYVALACSGVLLISVNALAWALHYDTATRTLAALFSLSLLTYPLNHAMTGLVMGAQKMTALARLTAGVVVGKVLLSVPLLWHWPTAQAYLALEVASAGGIAVVLWWHGRGQRLVPRLVRVSLSDLGWAVREGLAFLGLAFTYQVYNKVDLLLLAQFRGAVDVALYGAAYRLFEFLVMLPRPLAQALFPAMSAVAADPRRFARVWQSSSGVYWHTGCWIGGLCLFLTPVLAVLGPEYAASRWLFGVLVLGLPLMFWGWGVSTGLNAMGFQRLVFWVALGGTVLNVVLNVVLQPRFGAQAAAVVNTVTVAAFTLAYGVCLRRAFPGVGWFAPGAGRSFWALPVAAVVGVALWWVWWPLGAVGYAGVYGLWVWRFYPWSEEEARVFAKVKSKVPLLGRRF